MDQLQVKTGLYIQLSVLPAPSCFQIGPQQNANNQPAAKRRLATFLTTIAGSITDIRS
jgi:hypothetical protein